MEDFKTYIFYNTTTGAIISGIGYWGDATEMIALNQPKGSGIAIINDSQMPDMFTEYFPGGVRTTRPKISSVATWDKETVRGDGTDTTTLGTGLPNPTYMRVLPVEASGVEYIEGTCVDGSASISFNASGVYHITTEAWPYQDQTFIIGVDIHLPESRTYSFTCYDAIELDELMKVKYNLSGTTCNVHGSFNAGNRTYNITGYGISEHTGYKAGITGYAFTGNSSQLSYNRVTPITKNIMTTWPIFTTGDGLKSNKGEYTLDPLSITFPNTITYSKGSITLTPISLLTPSSVQSDINIFTMTNYPLDFGVDCDTGTFVSIFNDALEE